MKKVVLASFLACAAIAVNLPYASAQGTSGGATPAAAGCQTGAQVQMPAPEYAVYNNAMTQTTPQAKAAGLEQYLTQFPQSCVKATVLETIMVLDFSVDPTATSKAIDPADRLLQLDPTNLKALYVETYVRGLQAASIKDPAAQIAAQDTVASFAQKGLAAPKPAGMSDADFATMKSAQYPIFYSAIAYDAFLKKDMATAIDNYKKELAIASPDATKTPGSVLMDIFYMGEAYYQLTPPDYLDCAFYTSRAVAYAPDNFKAAFSPISKYCYKQYHGATDGYDAVLAAATANLNPPADFASTVKPAPTPKDIIDGIFKDTPDLGVLAVDDKEFILQNGTPDQAAKVWDTIKGKSSEFPGVLVIASTPAQLQVAISANAVQTKTADFTFNLTPPEPLPELKEHATPAEKLAYKKKQDAAQKQADAIAAATAVGQTVTLDGTYDSFTPNPVMIIMKDGAVVLPKAAPKAAPKAPVHTAHKAAAH